MIINIIIIIIIIIIMMMKIYEIHVVSQG